LEWTGARGDPATECAGDRQAPDSCVVRIPRGLPRGESEGVLAHELAHVVKWRRGDRSKKHDREWERIVRIMLARRGGSDVDRRDIRPHWRDGFRVRERRSN